MNKFIKTNVGPNFTGLLFLETYDRCVEIQDNCPVIRHVVKKTRDPGQVYGTSTGNLFTFGKSCYIRRHILRKDDFIFRDIILETFVPESFLSTGIYGIKSNLPLCLLVPGEYVSTNSGPLVIRNMTVCPEKTEINFEDGSSVILQTR